MQYTKLVKDGVDAIHLAVGPISTLHDLDDSFPSVISCKRSQHSRATTADKVSAWMFAKFKPNDGCRQLAGTVSRSARRMGPAVREL